MFNNFELFCVLAKLVAKILGKIGVSCMLKEMIDRWQKELEEKAGETESKVDDILVKVLNAIIDALQEIL